MSAYIIVDIEVTDPEIYEEYRKAVPATVSRYRGTFLVRGGKSEMLEGTWLPKRLIVLQFENIDRAKQWWASEEYRIPKELRQRAAVTNMVVVEGVT